MMVKINGCIFNEFSVLMDMMMINEDDDLLKKYNTIWDKVSADIRKESDSESVSNKKYLKTKMKSYGDEGTDFYDKEVPRAGSNHTCLTVIMIFIKRLKLLFVSVLKRTLVTFVTTLKKK